MACNIHIVGPHDSRKHTHTVIFLHGRDSDSQEFAGEFFESEASGPAGQPRTLLDLFPTIRWVFPSAQLLASERFDTAMSQWFDIWSVEEPEERVELQVPGIQQSVAALAELIGGEEALIPRSSIFLGGISQGFAIALATFIADGQGFAGLVGQCSWMPLASIVEGIALSNSDEIQLFSALRDVYICQPSQRVVNPRALKSTPIFLGHSSDDDVVPIKNGRRMRDILVHHLKLAVHFHEYEDGGHWINEPQGVDGIVEFLRTNMSQTKF